MHLTVLYKFAPGKNLFVHLVLYSSINMSKEKLDLFFVIAESWDTQFLKPAAFILDQSEQN